MITSLVQRWRDRRDSYRPAGEPIETHLFEVAAIPDDRTAKAFVIQHHYAGSYPAARFRFGLYRSGQLVGVAVASQPVRNSVLDLAPGTERVELGRLVLLDDVPANGESFFLGRVFELLRRSGVEGLVSFSDPMARRSAADVVVFPGHVGTIYQATNATYCGRATARTLRLFADGRVCSARAISKIRAGERGWKYSVEQLVAAGAPEPTGDLRAWLTEWLPKVTTTMRHEGCHRYIWAIDRRLRKFLPASLPYPKFTGRPS